VEDDMAVVPDPMPVATPGFLRLRRGAGRLLLLLVLAVVLAACAQLRALAPKKGDAADPDIRGLRHQFNELVALRKFGGLAGLVSEDTQLIEPSRTTSGRKNLVRAYEALVQKRPDLLLDFNVDAVERNPRWSFAAERGRWSQAWQEQGEPVEVRGTYYALWKRKDGRWRIHAQIMTPVSCKGARYCKSQE
jgi:hypothetical protein